MGKKKGLVFKPSTATYEQDMTNIVVKNARQVFDEMSHPDKAPRDNAKETELFANSNALEGAGFKLEQSSVDGVVVVLEDDDIDDLETTWGFALVGYFATSNPGLQAVDKLCKSWNVPCDLYPDVNGWMVFKFRSWVDRDKVVKGGPYSVLGNLLLLKYLPKMFTFGEKDIKTMHVWVNLPGLPLEFWNARALSKIGSAIGNPITTDRITKTKERIAYARVFVEVDASKELVREIPIDTHTGFSFNQHVHFEFEHKDCKGCNRVGHRVVACQQANAGFPIAQSQDTAAPFKLGGLGWTSLLEKIRWRDL